MPNGNIDSNFYGLEVGEPRAALRVRYFNNTILPRRQRGISEKHLRLAAFVIEQPKSGTWRQKMDAWNKAHPEGKWNRYQYGHAGNFQRDANSVLNRLKRLMHEEYPTGSVSRAIPEFVD